MAVLSTFGAMAARGFGWIANAASSAALYAWGDNTQGQLGLGDLTNRSSPVLVGNVAWSGLSANALSSYGVRTNGTLWAWGNNQFGELGNGASGGAADKSSPIQVGALTDWAKLVDPSPKDQVIRCFCIKTDGTLWAWGYGGYGALGTGNTTSQSSPVQVGADTDWLQIASANDSSLGIRGSGGVGSLYAWGRNLVGELGQGDQTPRSSPVQIGGESTWTWVTGGAYQAAGIRSGRLYSWGDNDQGQLGLGDLTNRSSPVQVGALTTWSKVRGGDWATFAIKTDGTMWAWGFNTFGQLGTSNTTSRSSPVQIGALTTWTNVFSGTGFCIATKTDGTLWGWGANHVGQLAQGNTTATSSPVQIGALTTWLIIATGGIHALGYKN